MTKDQMTLPVEDTAKGPVLYMAIKMGKKKWKLLFSTGEPKRNGQLRTYQRTIEGGDREALKEAIRRAKERLKLEDEVRVVSYYTV